MAKKKSAVDDFLAISDAQKRSQTTAFDREFAAEAGRSMNTVERSRWNRAKAAAKKRLRGRPAKGEGVQVISLSVEKGLLRRADKARAKAHKTRAQLVAEALETYLARVAS